MVKYTRSLVRNLRTYLKCWLARNTVLVLGDSHAAIFNHPHLQGCFPDTYFHVCFIGGATVSGLENPNSKTDSRRIFETALATCRHRKTTIVMLGEVDTGFVIWYRAAKYKESVDEMLKKTVTATLLEHTEFTLKFNALIQSFCEQHKVSFLSLDEDSLGENGLMNSKLLNNDPTDHHYGQLKYIKLLTPKLSMLLRQ